MAETTQLHDRTILILAACVAITGIVLLLIVAPDTDSQRYVLRGVVVERHGRSAVVQANVTVTGKNLTGRIERDVFWDGQQFVAVG